MKTEFLSSYIYGSLYISDVHIGASKNNFDLVNRGFSTLTTFLNDRRIMIKKVVDLGDTIECWIPDAIDASRNTPESYADPEVVHAMRHVYSCVFEGRQPEVIACAGNHQTTIVEGVNSPFRSNNEADGARRDLQIFLCKVLEGTGAKINMFGGVSEVEEGIIGHHGDLLNVGDELRKVLEDIGGQEVDLGVGIDSLNEDDHLKMEMQKTWANFKKYLWPFLDNVPKVISDSFFKVLVAKWKVEGLMNEGLRSERAIGEMWKNPFSNFSKLQFEMLKALGVQHEHPLIVSGHTHLPSMVTNPKGYNGTAVSLGAWEACHENPIIGLRRAGESGDDFSLLEFDPSSSDEGDWFVRDVVKLTST